MNTIRRPGQRTTHTVNLTLRLTDHQGDYGAITLAAVVSVLWGYGPDRIGADHYDPGTPDEVSFVAMAQQALPMVTLSRAVRSYVADNGEQCVRLVEHAP